MWTNDPIKMHKLPVLAISLARQTAVCAHLCLASLLLAACSSDITPDTSAEADEIRFRADVWQVMEGTRATFYTPGTQTSGSFTCAAYNAGSTTQYIAPTTVSWVTDRWEFSDGKHYWPATGRLDFFAYMPTTVPSYLSTPTYTTARNPQFTCTNLPMTYNSASPSEGQGSGLQEFVYALVTNQDKLGTNHTLQPTAGQVALHFFHPFARLKFQLSDTYSNIKINTITFKDIKNNGTFAYADSPQWTTTGTATDFVVTLNQTFTASPTATVQDLGADFLMIPQTFAGVITVNASWTDWGETIAHNVSTTLSSLTWQPGYSYTYTFNIRETDLIVNVTKFTEQW